MCPENHGISCDWYELCPVPSESIFKCSAANQGLSWIQATQNNAVTWITEQGSSYLAVVEKSLALVKYGLLTRPASSGR